MEKNSRPDEVTIAACKWLLAGGNSGEYTGPLPERLHGLAPLLSRETCRRDISLSSSALWFRLEQITRTILKEVAKDGIQLWAVKGFDLARSIYPFPGARPMCDADLFVRRKDRQSVISTFHRNRWDKGSPGDGIFTSDIVSEMKMFKQGTMVELHSHIFYFPATFPGSLPADLFENGRQLEPGLMGFAWHNALLLVIIHLLTNTSIRPVWWVDVCMLSQKVSESGTWDRFSANALGTRLGSSIAEVLISSREHLNAPVPRGVTTTLTNHPGSRTDILHRLKSGKRIPTLMNLVHLTGWKRVSWFLALLWLIITGQQPLKRE